MAAILAKLRDCTATAETIHQTDSGRYGTEHKHSCPGGGNAEGDPSFTVSTDAGPQTVIDHIRITYGKPSTKGGIVHTDFEGQHMSCGIELTPTKGDCVDSPVTQVHGAGELTPK